MHKKKFKLLEKRWRLTVRGKPQRRVVRNPINTNPGLATQKLYVVMAVKSGLVLIVLRTTRPRETSLPNVRDDRGPGWEKVARPSSPKAANTP